MALAPRFFLFSAAVELDHPLVDVGLLQRVQADQCLGQIFVDVLDGLADAFAEKLLRIAVAQLPGFVYARAGAAGYGRSAEGAVGQPHVDLDGRIAAAVENLAAMDVNDQ